MKKRISRLSVELDRFEVEIRVLGQAEDLSDATVHVAYMKADAEPADEDWNVAAMNVVTRNDGDHYIAEAMVGSGNIELPRAAYARWLKVEKTPQKLVGSWGVVEVY